MTPDPLSSPPPVLLSQERPVLFLDIDGVLHPDDAVYFDGRPPRPMGVGLFRWKKLLMDVLEKFPQVEVVVSSAWRWIFSYDDLMHYLPPEIAAKVTDVTDPEIQHRWLAIQDFIAKNKVTKFVILDDDWEAFPKKNFPELVKCFSKSGLSNLMTLNHLESQLERICNGQEKT